MIHDRWPAQHGGLINHSDRGSQYVSIKYTKHLAEAGIESSVGSVGNSYDNALDETINGLYKAEVIHRRTLAVVRSRRIRHARMGRLVQQQAIARADRPYSARPGRRTILSQAARHPHGSITQAKWPPTVPGRFMIRA